ncbi:MAG: hypothetical protein ABR502_05550 [Chitinophagaceae bacterium]
MSLLNNNKQKGKADKKKPQNKQGSKFISKPVNTGAPTQKTHRTGGTRGS